MVDNTQSGMPCSEFDALLMEAVEGKLNPDEMQRFRSHADSCGVCGPLFADAQSGFTWLQSLAEVDPPASLVHNILAATSERDAVLGGAMRPQRSTELCHCAHDHHARSGDRSGWLMASVQFPRGYRRD